MTHTLTTQVPLVERVIFLRKVTSSRRSRRKLGLDSGRRRGGLFGRRAAGGQGDPGDTLYVVVDGQVQVLGQTSKSSPVRGG